MYCILSQTLLLLLKFSANCKPLKAASPFQIQPQMLKETGSIKKTTWTYNRLTECQQLIHGSSSTASLMD